MTSTILSPGDPAYPVALADLPEARAHKPLPTLYTRGALPDASGVAVVGTRDASPRALAFARELAGDLARAGVAVWSGGAIGVDAAAHEGALDAGGVTVVIAGGGLDRPYPREHVPLFDRVVASGGALVARVPDREPPRPARFLQRNELLAALTAATVLVEAGFASGARSTAAAARRLARPLCVVPHAPWEPRGAGCALELARGARAITCAGDVLAAIGRPAPRRRRARVRGATLPLFAPEGAEQAAVYAALGDAPTHIDEVCERAGLPLPGVVGPLLTLTLRAVVVEGPAGFFRRVSCLG